MIASTSLALVIVTVLIGGKPEPRVNVTIFEGYQHHGTVSPGRQVLRKTNGHGEVRLSVADAEGDYTTVRPSAGGGVHCPSARVNRKPRRQPYHITIRCPAG